MAGPWTPKGQYVVATNDFLAAGGDGYLAFGEALKAGAGFREQGGRPHQQKPGLLQSRRLAAGSGDRLY